MLFTCRHSGKSLLDDFFSHSNFLFSFSLTELALEYKEDGNYQFQKKEYHLAIKAYTEGIKQKCEKTDLNAVLYSNRAAAHFHIGKYSI